MSSNIQLIPVDNDILLKITALMNQADSQYVNDASVTVTIKDRLGVNVAGVSWPQPMNYVDGSNGDYIVTIDRVAEFIDGVGYIAYIDISTPGGNDAHFECDLGAETRKSLEL